jgi:hypothetical protein
MCCCSRCIGRPYQRIMIANHPGSTAGKKSLMTGHYRVRNAYGTTLMPCLPRQKADGSSTWQRLPETAWPLDTRGCLIIRCASIGFYGSPETQWSSLPSWLPKSTGNILGTIPTAFHWILLGTGTMRPLDRPRRRYQTALYVN